MRSARKFLRKRRLQRAMTNVLSEPKVYEETRNFNISHVGPDTLDGAAYQGGKQSWMMDGLPTAGQIALMYKLGIQISAATAIASSPPSRKVYVDRVTTTYTLRNNFNQDAEVRMYMLWPRNDISYQQYRNASGATPSAGIDALTLLTNLTTTGGAGTPTVALNNLWPRDPIPDASLAANSIRDYHYEWTPYKDSWWTSFFKIKPLATFRLRPGESREWTYRCKPFMVSKAKLGLGYGQDFDDVLPGVTFDKAALRGHPIVFFGVRGTIVHNQVAMPTVNYAGGNGFACYNTADGANAWGQVPGDFNIDGIVHRVWRVRRVVEAASGAYERSSAYPIGLFAANSGPSALLKQWAEVLPGESTGGA